MPKSDDQYIEAEFVNEYSEEGFWDKVTKYARVAGQEVIEKALCLYYVMQRPETPTWAKATIMGALGYFISPIDAIPDFTPVVGYADDLGVLVLAIATVAAFIDENVRRQASEKMKQWFG